MQTRSTIDRDLWIHQQLLLRENDFTTHQNFCFLGSTWNVKETTPPASPFPDLIHIEGSPLPDIVAISLQEVDMSAGALLWAETPLKVAPWENAIRASLPAPDFTLLASKQLVGMLLLIFVRNHLVGGVSDLQLASLPVGFGGIVGNKGAVAAHLFLHRTSVCIVNAHLPPFEEALQKRNDAYHQLCERGIFQRQIANSVIQSFGILDHDYVFWLGDLNYRLTGIPDTQIRSFISEGKWSELLIHDQLLQQQQSRLAFGPFQEGQITFPPTYKFLVGTTQYDGLRSPAWCDRILWRGNGARLLHYTSRPQLISSDHLPVAAQFEIVVRSVIPDKRASVMSEVLRQLSILENDLVAIVAIEPQALQFGQVFFDSPVSATFSVRNNGQSIAKGVWILPEGSPLVSSIHLWPHELYLRPGEAQQVTCILHIRESSDSVRHIGDTLMLHLYNGSDYFVTLDGDFCKSAFGSTLEEMALSPLPYHFRHSQGNELLILSKSLSIPTEVWRLVDFLRNIPPSELRMAFAGVVSPEAVLPVKLALYFGAPFQHAVTSASAVGAVLLQLLASLPVSVIPQKFYQLCVRSLCGYQPSPAEILSMLSNCHKATWDYLLNFLAFFCSVTGVSSLVVGSIFGPVLLRSEQSEKFTLLQLQEEIVTCQQFILYFLNNKS